MPNQKIIAGVAVIVMSAGALALKSRPTHAPQLPPPAEPTHADIQLPPTRVAPLVELATAILDRSIQVQFKTNGRDKLRGQFTNVSGAPVRLRIPAGQLFENKESTVVLVRAREFDLAAGKPLVEDFQTAATASSNKVVVSACEPRGGTIPKLSRLLKAIQDRPELSAGTIQTAVLALTENLPVSAFAKFAQTGLELPSQFDTAAFRAETSEIIGALAFLRELGIPDTEIALTVDPQLKIEAMIDPLAHAAAMRYYGLTEKTEWDFWKNELLAGHHATRHYALFGIARYYPDVALNMLPAWVREVKTPAVYRSSAVQALAETQRPEALSVLRQLAFELGNQSELGQAARTAANFLDGRLNKKTASAKAPVGFRITKDLPPQTDARVSAPVLALAN